MTTETDTTTRPREVPGTTDGGADAHRIVVGVDGSEQSKAALRWAVGQARATGASLRVVMTWEMPSMAYSSGMPYPGDLDLAGGSRRALDGVLAEVVGDRRGLVVSSVVVEGHPAVALLEAARSADLLVVGTRGHGGFAGMLLGSVSEHCVAHASCPVVVVPTPAPPA